MRERTLRVLSALPSGQPPDLSNSDTADRAVWDKRDVPAGCLSVPRELAARLHGIRSELLAWVYDLGRVCVAGQEVQEHLQCGDTLSMWWCSLLFEKHPKVTPDIYLALKLRALEYLVEEGGYTEICLHGGDVRLRETLRQFCAATGRAFRHVPGPLSQHTSAVPGLTGHVRRLYSAMPGLCKAALRFGLWLWQVKLLLPHTTAERPVGVRGTIATYFPNVDAQAAEAGHFRSRYWESLHDALAEADAPAVNWLFIAFRSPQYSFRQCLRLRDTFRKAGQDTFHYLEEFLDGSGIVRALRRYVRLVRVSRRLENAVRPHFHFSGSRMNMWPTLGPCWRDSFQGWRALERCLHREGILAWTAWAGPQRWTIFPMENCPWERMLTQAVRHAGHGPVYGTQHSTVRPTDFRYFDDARTFAAPDCVAFQPDTLYGNGEGACAEMTTAALPREKLGMVEALRYMYLAGRQGTAQGSLASTTGGRLLVVTSFFADEVEEHIRVLAQWLREAPHSQKAVWEVCIKAHPYLAVEPYLGRHFPQGCAPEVWNAPMNELLTPGTVVWASNSTTVALEAAIMGLPVMVQLPADDVDLCPLQGVPGVIRITGSEEVTAALERPVPPHLAADYLALDPRLPRWRALLGLLKDQ